MRDHLVIAELRHAGWAYRFDPPLGLPIRCGGSVWYAEHEVLGMQVAALARSGLRAAVGEWVHAAYQRAMAPGYEPRDLGELTVWFVFLYRVTAIPPPPEKAEASSCRPGCLGGNGCAHGRR